MTTDLRWLKYGFGDEANLDSIPRLVNYFTFLNLCFLIYKMDLMKVFTTPFFLFAGIHPLVILAERIYG